MSIFAQVRPPGPVPVSGYVFDRLKKVWCNLSSLSGFNFTVMPYCWYLMGIGDFVSSDISIHL